MRATTQLNLSIPWLLLLLLLISCAGPVIEPKPGPSEMPIQTLVSALADDGEVLARALENSSLFTALDDYPVSVIYVEEDDFTAYLDREGLSAAEFLSSEKLGAFLETLIIPDASVGDPERPDGSYQTIAGTNVVIENTSPGVGIGGAVAVTINGKKANFCSLHTPIAEGSAATATLLLCNRAAV